jgi:hypothetical protein
VSGALEGRRPSQLPECRIKETGANRSPCRIGAAQREHESRSVDRNPAGLRRQFRKPFQAFQAPGIR